VCWRHWANNEEQLPTLSLHCASEAGGFRGPIAAQLVHNRSKQGANEERPATRPMTTRKKNKRTKEQKEQQENSNHAKNHMNDIKQFVTPKNGFIPALVLVYTRPHKFVDLLKIACDIYKPNRGGSIN
jgi:hypothetical protein